MSLAASGFATVPQDEELSCSRMKTHSKEIQLLNACRLINKLFSGVVHFHSGASSFRSRGLGTILSASLGTTFFLALMYQTPGITKLYLQYDVKIETSSS